MRALEKAALALRMISGLIIAALVLVTGYDVIMRYVFSRPLDWSITISSVGLIAIIMLAIPDVALRGEHISLDLFYRRFSPRFQRISDGTVAAVSFLVCLTAGIVAFNTFASFLGAGLHTAGTFNIPVWIHYLLVAFGFLTSACTIPLQYVLRYRLNNEAPGPESSSLPDAGSAGEGRA